MAFVMQVRLDHHSGPSGFKNYEQSDRETGGMEGEERKVPRQD